MGTLVIALFWAHVDSAVLHMGRDVDVINMSHFAAFMSFHRSVEKYLRTAGKALVRARSGQREPGEIADSPLGVPA